MQPSAVCAFVAILGIASSAAAEARGPATPSVGRWQMTTRADGAIVRLDTATGEVSVCRPKPGGMACEAVPDDRAVLEREIDRLTDEKAALEVRAAELEARVADLERGGTGRDAAAAEARKLERLLDFAEEAIRRFYGLVEDLRKDWGDDPTGSTEKPR